MMDIQTQNRKLRNRLLSESDWTQIPDNNLSVEERQKWSSYRNKLRNLPEEHSNEFNNYTLGERYITKFCRKPKN